MYPNFPWFNPHPHFCWVKTHFSLVKSPHSPVKKWPSQADLRAAAEQCGRLRGLYEVREVRLEVGGGSA